MTDEDRRNQEADLRAGNVVFERPRTCTRCDAVAGELRDGRVVEVRIFDTPNGRGERLCFSCFSLFPAGWVEGTWNEGGR